MLVAGKALLELRIEAAREQQTAHHDETLSAQQLCHSPKLARRRHVTCELDKSTVRSRTRTLRSGMLGLAILYAAVGFHVCARAQDDASATRSQKLFAAAQQAKRAGDLARALCLMQRAQDAWSSAAFSFNVAQLQRELGLCEQARENYQAFLGSERAPARRKEAERALAELARCTPRASHAEAAFAADSCATWTEAALSGTPSAEPQPRSSHADAANSGEVGEPASRAAAAGDTHTPSSTADDASRAAAADGPAARSGTIDQAGRLVDAEAGSPAAGPAAAARSSEARASAPASRTPATKVPTPAEVARNQAAPALQPLAAGSSERSGSKRGVPQYLPWIFGAAGVVCVALAGYEFAQMSSAQRQIAELNETDPKSSRLDREGRTAETLTWVFGSAGTLSLGTALVLALVGSDDAPPSAPVR